MSQWIRPQNPAGICALFEDSRDPTHRPASADAFVLGRSRGHRPRMMSPESEDRGVAADRNFGLVLLAILLLAVSVLPALFNWRLIASYAAIPLVRAQFERTFVVESPGVQPLTHVSSLAADPAGALYLMDGPTRRVLVSAGGDPRAVVTLIASGTPVEIEVPVALVVGPDDTLYVLDGATGVVGQLNQEGDLLSTRTLAATGSLMAVGVDGSIYVGDLRLSHVRKFRHDGEPAVAGGTGATPPPAGVGRLASLGVAGNELLVLTDRFAIRLDADGRILGTSRLVGKGGPLARSPDGALLMADVTTGRVFVLDPMGRTIARVVDSGGSEGRFAPIRAIAATRTHLYISHGAYIGIFRFQDHLPNGS